ncbi:hypothetical protein DRO03_11805 [Methanosarcinales archaeon]|nr:MAG: hypothetical protein DRO03_11805 [Methanosarcinales archaeon]
MSNDQIIFIGKEGGKSYIYLTNLDGTVLSKITETGKQPFRLYPSYDGVDIYWEEGYTSNSGSYSIGTWRSQIDGSEHVEIDWKLFYQPVFSLSGQHVAYMSGPFDEDPELYISNVDGTGKIKVDSIELGENEFFDNREMSWSTNGEELLVRIMGCDEVCDQYKEYLVSVDGVIIIQLPEDNGRGRVAWSPDNQVLLYKQVTDSIPVFVLLDTISMSTQVLEVDYPENSYFRRWLWLPMQ